MIEFICVLERNSSIIACNGVKFHLRFCQYIATLPYNPKLLFDFDVMGSHIPSFPHGFGMMRTIL